MWSTGDQIVYREVTHGKVWTARPVTVIQDTPNLIALYLHNNAQEPLRRTSIGFDFLDQELDVFVKPNLDVCRLLCKGQRRGDRVGRPYTGLHNFCDTSPNLEWRWKDTDDLDRAQSIGLFSREQVSAIRAEGQRVVEKIRSRLEPFDGSWTGWKPPLGWNIPHLCEDWAQIG